MSWMFRMFARRVRKLMAYHSYTDHSNSLKRDRSPASEYLLKEHGILQLRNKRRAGRDGKERLGRRSPGTRRQAHLSAKFPPPLLRVSPATRSLDTSRLEKYTKKVDVKHMLTHLGVTMGVSNTTRWTGALSRWKDNFLSHGTTFFRKWCYRGGLPL